MYRNLQWPLLTQLDSISSIYPKEEFSKSRAVGLVDHKMMSYLSLVSLTLNTDHIEALIFLTDHQFTG